LSDSRQQCQKRRGSPVLTLIYSSCSSAYWLYSVRFRGRRRALCTSTMPPVVPREWEYDMKVKEKVLPSRVIWRICFIASNMVMFAILVQDRSCSHAWKGHFIIAIFID